MSSLSHNRNKFKDCQFIKFKFIPLSDMNTSRSLIKFTSLFRSTHSL